MKHFIVVLAAVMVVALGCASAPATETKKADAPAGKSIYTNDFENGVGDVMPKGPVKLEIATDVAHAGKSSLKVFGRTDTWHAPELDITGMTTAAGTYLITCWVLVPKDSAVTGVGLTVETSAGGAKNWIHISKSAATEAGKWVQVVGKYKKSAPLDKASVYVEPSEKTGDFYVDDVEITTIAE
jgi:endo-1,4-beta-xylanase